jgi:hypothetical protein
MIPFSCRTGKNDRTGVHEADVIGARAIEFALYAENVGEEEGVDLRLLCLAGKLDPQFEPLEVAILRRGCRQIPWKL